MKYKATILAPVLCLIAVTAQPCQAALIWLTDGAGGADQSMGTKAVTGSNKGVTTDLVTKDSPHTPSQAFNVGDSFTATFTMTISSALPADIPYTNNYSLGLGVIDTIKDQGVGMYFDLNNPSDPRFSVGYDNSSSGAGNFGKSGGGSYITSTVASEDLLNNNDTSTFSFTVQKLATNGTADRFQLDSTWGTTGTTASYTVEYADGIQIENLSRLGMRINGLGGTDAEATYTVSSFELDYTAVPEPSSAALLGLGGLALILRRRK